VVVQSVPALQVVAGNPAKFIRQRAAEWALPSH
jgi:acetyltransferase-like isoleucine patch superfamily enzyme